jgi:indolepyruvate ferredoxin oxidoreductase
VGAAYQAGALPLRAASIEAAIHLNGKSVRQNLQAFRWGRLSVADPARVERELGQRRPGAAEEVAAQRRRLAGEALRAHDQALAELGLGEEGSRQLSLRLAELCAYQDLRYAHRYLELVRAAREVDAGFPDRGWALTLAVARNYFKLMAYKDEYEVARLATRPEALQRLEALFEGPLAVSHYLHPPTLRALFPGKLCLGPWVRPALALLKRLKGLRGTALDPFGRHPCRKLERALIDWYRWLAGEVLMLVDARSYGLAVRVLDLPDRIRGYEQVKIRNAAQVQQEAAELLAQLRNSS